MSRCIAQCQSVWRKVKVCWHGSKINLPQATCMWQFLNIAQHAWTWRWRRRTCTIPKRGLMGLWDEKLSRRKMSTGCPQLVPTCIFTSDCVSVVKVLTLAASTNPNQYKTYITQNLQWEILYLFLRFFLAIHPSFLSGNVLWFEYVEHGTVLQFLKILKLEPVNLQPSLSHWQMPANIKPNE